MRTSTVISVLSTIALASAQSDAPVVSSNPLGASYFAVLPVKEGSTLRATVSAASGANGKGVEFAISVSGLPTEGGPFMYHIHEKPVPADGNCTGTGAHLDPYKRGEEPPCNPATKEKCQTGDLSGKYGKINGTTYSATYNDPYSATDPKNPAYFGNLSIVFHLANKTRIGCANFSAAANGIPTASSGFALPTGAHHNATLSISTSATGTGSPDSGATEPSSTPPSPSAPLATGGATRMALNAGAVVAGAAALMML
ncbi:Cu,Zn superoxide dismutase-like protein [Zopfia rhizophila CBS 207.26]|uniref:superoxide dismutase n=1 Tax=Zopfia rhizophila CBS 207.26 TaxID=1314779 RepID=A0A6A6DTV5_9PEZI|nr:Cu,Zn superoxide dismutase-like protein [Zopfia rhizophila CBS 207.26]